MSNKKEMISKVAKDTIDDLMIELNMNRPGIIKLLIAEALLNFEEVDKVYDELVFTVEKWTMPEGIIKGTEFLVIKHLLIERFKRELTDEELSKLIAKLIEVGARMMAKKVKDKVSLESIYLTVLV